MAIRRVVRHAFEDVARVIEASGGAEGIDIAQLERVLERHCKEPAGEIVDAVFAAVNRFVGRVEAFDDQTVAVLKIKETKKKK